MDELVKLIISLQNQINNGWTYTVVDDGIQVEHEDGLKLRFRNEVALRNWLEDREF